MKRKIVKIALIIVSVLVVLVLALALFISPVAKNYIEKHSQELIGRKVLMHDLHLNIFTGKMEVDSFRMYEANGRDLFASVDTFMVRVSLLKLIGSRVEVTKIKVVRPYAEILQNGDKFNFDDLMPKKETTKAKKKTKSNFPKSIVLKNIFIRGGRLVYKDLQLKNTISMNEMGVLIPMVKFDQGSTLAGIRLKIGEQATLDSHLDLNMKTNEYRLRLKVGKLPVGMFTPYIRAYYNVGKLDGLVNGDLLITGNMNHIMNFTLSGTGNATAFNLTNNLGEQVAYAKFADTKINKMYYPTSTYLFDYIHASDVNLNFVLKPTTNNVSVLFKPEVKTTQAPAAPEAPMTVKIKDLHVLNSQVTFTDKTLKTPFSLPVQKIDFQAANFDMNRENEFKAKAAFPEGGNVRLNWKGNMNDLANQKIFMNLQNLSMRLFSPYCLNYTAFDITGGNLNFVSNNTIRNNNIKSMNALDAYKMSVGKKHKDLKPEYKVPLRLAVYIMKDKDDKIKLELPVEGNIHDPKFSYRKIIFKTLVNLMVKVAVSPVRFLANSLGMSSDKMESVAIDPLQMRITAEQYSQLNDLARIVKSKPDMNLSMTQFINMKETLPLYALYKTKLGFLNSLNQKEGKAAVTYEEVQAVKDNDKSFLEYLDNLLKSQGKPFGDVSLQEKVNALYLPDSIEAEYRSKLERRNESLKAYLITTCSVPEKNLVIRTADKAALDAYDKKAVYKIDMSMPGEEKPEE